MKEEMEYVHHPLEQAVHNLACLATPITQMKGLVDNLYKDAEEQIKALMKEHKALEIIKKDPQRALLISDYKDWDEYINDKDPYYIEKELMKKDEFDLLKEVMK